MLPQEDQGVFVLDPERLHYVALTIGFRGRRPPSDRASLLADRLNLKKTVGSVHVYSSGKLRAL
ncbi:hypothetical protein D3C78_1630090 [compost metagenome]